MTFLHTGILAAGLGAVALPILIHLLMRRRRKPVPWGAMRFVIMAYQRTQRRRRLERFLLLAARVLLVALIALALARPVFGPGAALAGASGQGRTVVILIDDAIASGLRDEGGLGASASAGGEAPASDDATALRRHVRSAQRLIAALSEGDRVGIIALAAPARPLLWPPTPNHAGASRLLETLTPQDSRTDLPGGLTLAGGPAPAGADAVNPDSAAPPAETNPNDAAPAAGPRLLVLVSDLLPGSVDTRTPLPALGAGVALAALRPGVDPAGADNVAVTALTPMRRVVLAGPGEQAQLATVGLRRSGPGVGSASSTRVRLRLLGLPRGPEAGAAGVAGAGVDAGEATALVRWSPGQREAAASLALDAPGLALLRDEAAAAVLEARIEGDALSADDAARVGVEVRQTLRVGLLGPAGAGLRDVSPASMRAGDWLALALRPREDAGVEIVPLAASTLDAPRLAGLDALIITAPQRLGPAEWARVADFVDDSLAAGPVPGPDAAAGAGGRLLLVCPPGDVNAHTWTDAMTAALGLDWTIAREPVTYAPDDPARPRLSAQAPRAAGAPASTGAGAGAGSGAGPDAASATRPPDAPAAPGSADARAGSGPESSGTLDLLAALRGELPELLEPVNVLRVLPLTPARPGTAGATPLLSLSDGVGVLWAAPVRRAARPAGSSARGAGALAAGPSTLDATIDATPAEGRGVVVFMAFSPELSWTDLPAKPLMVPLMQELVRQGVGVSRGGVPVVAGVGGGRPMTPGQTVSLVPWVGLRGPAAGVNGRADRAGASAAGAAAGDASGAPPQAPAGVAPAGVEGPGLSVDDVGRVSEPLRRAGVLEALDARGASRGLIVINPDPAGTRTDAADAPGVEAWLRAGVRDDAFAWLDAGADTQPAPDNRGPSAPNATTPDAPRSAGGAAPSAWPAGRSLASLADVAARPRPVGAWVLGAALLLALVELALARASSHAQVVGQGGAGDRGDRASGRNASTAGRAPGAGQEAPA